ncbi:MAG TPA: adenylosuccinate lyase [Synergistales bacterium]|nr:adenylosuccinate lyase [Synergistales bacterium]
MIERYETEEMKRIWSDENRFQKWLEVELAVCEAWTEEGKIPAEAMDTIRKRAGFDMQRIAEIESSTHHDVIAFVTSVAEKIGPEGRFIHLGLTSSDVVDTAGSLLILEALAVLTETLKSFSGLVLEKAREYRHIPCVGRTHGIHGEPTTFGLKLLNWHSQLLRDLERLELANKHIRAGKISGAVGTYAHCPPQIEEKVCSKLGLQRAAVSNQILQRDRHAEVLTAIAILGSTMERIATEIRHLQRTEVLEAAEPFSKGQKGSSAMPHKRNPILSERVCGMARLLRGYALASMENIALWHERDISHSSVERVAWPDAFHLAHYSLKTLMRILAGLQVDPGRMAGNLEMTRGLLFSQRVLLFLIEEMGVSREEAYAIVQENAMRCWAGEGHLRDLLSSDPRVSRYLDDDALDLLFDYRYFTRYVDEIFSRFENKGETDPQNA